VITAVIRRAEAHQQQFHNVEVAVRTQGLDNKNIGAAHVFVTLKTDFAIGKNIQDRAAEFHMQIGGHCIGQLLIGRTGKEQKFIIA
jgi:hypothetical protein